MYLVMKELGARLTHLPRSMAVIGSRLPNLARVIVLNRVVCAHSMK